MTEFREFLAEASKWSVGDFARWWRFGIAGVTDAQNKRKAVAFRYVLLDEGPDEADQIITAINELIPRAYQTACVAIQELLNNLPNGASPLFVQYVFKLAATLRPDGLTEILHHLLQRQAVRDDFSAWRDAIRAGIVALCEYPYSEEIEDLIEEVRSTDAWSDDLIRHHAIARLRVNPKGWLSILSRAEADLKHLKDRRPLQFRLLLRETARIVKSRRIERDLPELVGGDYKHLSWLADEMTKNDAIHLDPETGVRVGEDSTAIHLSRPGRSIEELFPYVHFIARKTSRRVSRPDEARARMLTTLERVEGELAS